MTFMNPKFNQIDLKLPNFGPLSDSKNLQKALSRILLDNQKNNKFCEFGPDQRKVLPPGLVYGNFSIFSNFAILEVGYYEL